MVKAAETGKGFKFYKHDHPFALMTTDSESVIMSLNPEGYKVNEVIIDSNGVGIMGSTVGNIPFGRVLYFDSRQRIRKIKWYHTTQSFYDITYRDSKRTILHYDPSEVKTELIQVPECQIHDIDDSTICLEIYSETLSHFLNAFFV